MLAGCVVNLLIVWEYIRICTLNLAVCPVYEVGCILLLQDSTEARDN